MKRNKFKLLILFLVLFMGIGFATYAASYNIFGNLTFNDLNATIFFSELEVDEDLKDYGYSEVKSETEIAFGSSLKQPGDFYSFKIKINNNNVNYDAAISKIVINGLTPDNRKYIDYSIKYLDDNTDVSTSDIIERNTSRDIIITLEYKDINIEDVPKESINANLTLSIVCKQANEKDYERFNKKIKMTINDCIGDYVVKSDYSNRILNIVVSNSSSNIYRLEYENLDSEVLLKKYETWSSNDNVTFKLLDSDENEIASDFVIPKGKGTLLLKVDNETNDTSSANYKIVFNMSK